MKKIYIQPTSEPRIFSFSDLLETSSIHRGGPTGPTDQIAPGGDVHNDSKGGIWDNFDSDFDNE